MWRPGNKLVHPFNPELGVGVILRVEGRFLHVLFPEVDRETGASASSGWVRCWSNRTASSSSSPG